MVDRTDIELLISEVRKLRVELNPLGPTAKRDRADERAAAIERTLGSWLPPITGSLHVDVGGVKLQ